MSFSLEDFNGMVLRELPVWRRVALRIVHCAGDADDAVQSALLRFWRRNTAGATPRNPAGYVTVCVVHACYELLHRRGREYDKLQELARRPEPDERDHRLDGLQAAIARLPELYRDTIQLAVLEERSGEEAAALLGCSTNTLYQRIHKAKRLLKAEMSGHDERE